MEPTWLWSRGLRAHARGAARALSWIAAALLAVHLAGCNQTPAPAAEKKKTASAPAVPVIVAPVLARTMPVRLQAIGNVEAQMSVAVKSRVDGQIVKVYFSDGQEVKEGQALYELDPRPFQTMLQQAEATLQRDQAQLDRARTQRARYEDLLKKGFVSADAYAQFVVNADTAQATVAASRAAVENAKLQLEYATIRAPISGRTGKILVQLGNMVKANDTGPLVVINQVAPVYLSFAVPEQYLGPIRRYMAAGKLPVEATTTEAHARTATGELAFIDNTVDTITGTVRLRALFPNQDRLLWPGQFVTASITLREEQDAIVVPSEAVQTGPKGQFVYVVKPDMSAEYREVTVERADGAQSIIAKGLAAGETVVTVGQSRLIPGIKVNPKTEGKAS